MYRKVSFIILVICFIEYMSVQLSYIVSVKKQISENLHVPIIASVAPIVCIVLMKPSDLLKDNDIQYRICGYLVRECMLLYEGLNRTVEMRSEVYVSTRL